MSETVIRVENLSKKYIIGHQKQERYAALRDVLANQVKSIGQIFSRNGDKTDPAHEEFWALKDVSFEIKQGDRVGIIGRNGAGKSTLLKILSRITEPTEGRISINGRVASLLEVGTGFHPELTGRENVYLNGAILGMDRYEIKKKFDEIVAFAEVEKFLDTPVKRYSSGMYVRLAFAVAAHLEPEILIVDEVLAVGDAQFQKKCLGKMEDVGKEGRTVLFVSHNMGTINQLCNQAYLLHKGELLQSGDVKPVINKYLHDQSSKNSHIVLPYKNKKGGQYVEVKTLNAELVPVSEFICDESIHLEFIYEIRSKLSGLFFAFIIENSEGTKVLFSESREGKLNIERLVVGRNHFYVDIPPRILAPDSYFITVASNSNSERIDIHERVLTFNLSETEFHRDKRPGVLALKLDWQVQRTSNSQYENDSHKFTVL
jgi:lipopolysaccharide transport system ATP-binding protein